MIKIAQKAKSGPQIKYGDYGLEQGQAALHQVSSNVSTTLTYAKIREMRKDPTINLLRRVLVAPPILTQWTIHAEDSAPAEAKEFFEECILPLKNEVLYHSFMGGIDFGWQGFEKVFQIHNGLICIKKLKPLLHDLTTILIKEGGDFDGFYQEYDNIFIDSNIKPKWDVWIPLRKSLIVSFDVEGTDWRGQSTLANVEIPYNSWQAAEATAKRYDKKIAGAQWVVYYPVGETEQSAGSYKDNGEIANDILQALQASGGVAVPTSIDSAVDSLNDSNGAEAWRIELITPDGGQQAKGFVDRQKYLDSLKARGFGITERSLLEGSFGTKAEATEHASFTIANIEIRANWVIDAINHHIINHLLEWNWGKEYRDTVKIKTSPISSEVRQFLQNVFEKIVSNGTFGERILDDIDTKELTQRLHLPVNQEERTIE